MTRNEKLHKLANAIREYRGRIHLPSDRWIYPPNPGAYERVKAWIQRLGLNEYQCLEHINNFKSFADFEKWMKGL